MKQARSTFFGMLILLMLASPLFTKAENQETNLPTEPVLIPILIYHRVLPKASNHYDYTPELLEEHLRFFKENGYTPITALDLLEMLEQPEQLPQRPVVLTFDDGHKSHYTEVFPLLKKYGYQATFFVYTNVIAEKSEKQLTWDDLRVMRQSGMDIESHTKSHPHLTQILKDESQQAYLKRLSLELQDSKLILEKHLQQKVDLLAYPYGWYNKTIETLAVQAGYRGIFTVNWGANLPTDNPLRIKRRVMENTMSREDLKTLLAASRRPIQIIYPEDAATFAEAPEIKFKITDSSTDTVEIKVRSVIDKISQNKEGFFTWPGLKELSPGYHMIVIKGFDKENQPFIHSWGFDYQK